MQGIPVWHKFKKHAAIHLLRWHEDFSAKVWEVFTTKLSTLAGGSRVAEAPVAMAIQLRQQHAALFARLVSEVTTTFSVTEQQLWALLIDRASSDTTSVDELSDAYEQLLRLGAVQQNLDMALLHGKNTKYRETQSENAQQPRNVLDTLDGEVAVSTLIEDISKDERYQDMYALELWPIFIAKLEKCGAAPVQSVASKARSRVTYFVDGGERSMLDETFTKKVSSFRSKAKKKNSRSQAT